MNGYPAHYLLKININVQQILFAKFKNAIYFSYLINCILFQQFDNFPNDQGRRKVRISSISHFYLSDTMEPFDVYSILRRRPSLCLFLFIIQMFFIAIARIEALPDIIKIGKKYTKLYIYKSQMYGNFIVYFIGFVYQRLLQCFVFLLMYPN